MTIKEKIKIYAGMIGATELASCTVLKCEDTDNLIKDYKKFILDEARKDCNNCEELIALLELFQVDIKSVEDCFQFIRQFVEIETSDTADHIFYEDRHEIIFYIHWLSNMIAIPIMYKLIAFDKIDDVDMRIELHNILTHMRFTLYKPYKDMVEVILEECKKRYGKIDIRDLYEELPFIDPDVIFVLEADLNLNTEEIMNTFTQYSADKIAYFKSEHRKRDAVALLKSQIQAESSRISNLYNSTNAVASEEYEQFAKRLMDYVEEFNKNFK